MFIRLTIVMNKISKLLGTLSILLSLSVVVAAQEVIVLDFDAARSQIKFTVASFPHAVEGTFKLKSGHVQLDTMTGKADGAIAVDATTGDSGNSWRDGDMRRDILESNRFPEIIFTPQSFVLAKQYTGKPTVTAHGILALHGSNHPIDISLVFHQSENEVVASGRFAIPYVEWGLKDPSLLLFRAAKTVDVELAAIAHVRTGTNPVAKLESESSEKTLPK
jgi:polyisoprenoid-binding protein YceI